jgi:hypothetical protein
MQDLQYPYNNFLMSLNNLQLPEAVIAGLYKELLVLPDKKDREQEAITDSKSQTDSADGPAEKMVTDIMSGTEQSPGIEPPPSAATIDPAYSFLGGHLKKIVLLQSSPDALFLPEPHLAFLTKMLEACKMNLADVAILNHLTQAVTITRLKAQLNPATIILFGLEPTEIKLPFTIPAFKIQEYDHCRYLCSPALNALNQDTEEGKLLKSKLWVCLRKLFEI